MTSDSDDILRRAIGGESTARTAVVEGAPSSSDAVLVAMAAVLMKAPDRLDRASSLATTGRDRQVVAIAAAFLSDDRELVDALARDHLADYPDSLIVAWIASS